MLAVPAPEPFDSDHHLFEPKWDGFRCLAFVDPGAFPGRGWFLQSRNGRELTTRFPELAALGETGWRRTVLDGELVALRGGRADFHALQRRAAWGAGGVGRPPVVLVAFDLLMDHGEDLTGHPLSRRRARLAERLASRAVPGLVLCEAFPGEGRRLFAAAVAHGLEGIVAKHRDGPYLPGRRSPLWLKVRRWQEVDCVVGGLLPGHTGGIGALLVGAYRDPGARDRGEPLVYLGRVGVNLGGAQARRLAAALRPRPHPPFAAVPERHGGAVWVEPERVCRVAYAARTPDGRLRHPVFRGFREDKGPGECVLPGAEARDGGGGGA